MNQLQMIETLGRAFSMGEIDTFLPLLAEDCLYVSQYADVERNGATEIATYLKTVFHTLDESTAYTYRLITLTSVLSSGLTLSDLSPTPLCPYGLLLYQPHSKKPVAVVVCAINSKGRFQSICLSRDKIKFSPCPFSEENDSPADLPSTVIPYGAENFCCTKRTVNGPGQQEPELSTNEIGSAYIWRKADEYARQWLPKQGYIISDSAIFYDCIGYHCHRKDCAYTVFLYAYGRKRPFQLDGTFCTKLEKLPFAQRSTILVLGLNIYRYFDGEKVQYRVRNDAGSNQAKPKLWLLKKVNGEPILEALLTDEMMERIWMFMYAFNHEDIDVYDCLVVDRCPSVEGSSFGGGIQINAGFYEELRRIHQQYGTMKLGYASSNNRVYTALPYVDGFGAFGWRMHGRRIKSVICYPFDGKAFKGITFLKTTQQEPEDLLARIPKLIHAVPFPPAPTERFAVKLFFSNGECRKYVLPISGGDEQEEAVSYRRHVFSDGIWSSVSVVSKQKSCYTGYPNRGPAIQFKNTFTIAGTRCYLESKPYSEPECVDEVVYSDGIHRVKKLWTWNAYSLRESRESGILIAQIYNSSPGRCNFVFGSIDGKRMNSLTFRRSADFYEGLAYVSVTGRRYGYIDLNMNWVIPMKYDKALPFRSGKAIVRRGDQWCCVDRTGQEQVLGANVPQRSYQEIAGYVEGMCRVSVLSLGFYDLAHPSEKACIAGIWGFVNESGEEVIPPQYIYADDFENGIAVVAKGHWEVDPDGLYYAEEELWGAIDKTGKAVIPFIFDEINNFWGRSDLLMAHYGGWKAGHWGVIDLQGNWLVEPLFAGILQHTSNDLIAFYMETPDLDAEEPLLGIYDLAQKKVLLEPQFSEIEFRENGDIAGDVFDQKRGYPVEKIIDRSGKERFPSSYSWIEEVEQGLYAYFVSEANDFRQGLLDKDGNVLCSFAYNMPCYEVFLEHNRVRYLENGKEGVKDFNGNVIIPAIYREIHNLQGPFYTVSVGDNRDPKVGLITKMGKTVIPAKYDRIHCCQDPHYFLCYSYEQSPNERYEMYVVEDL